jgi:hypothetical protein
MVRHQAPCPNLDTGGEAGEWTAASIKCTVTVILRNSVTVIRVVAHRQYRSSLAAILISLFGSFPPLQSKGARFQWARFAGAGHARRGRRRDIASMIVARPIAAAKICCHDDIAGGDCDVPDVAERGVPIRRGEAAATEP